jgi:hypothetical protein
MSIFPLFTYTNRNVQEIGLVLFPSSDGQDMKKFRLCRAPAQIYFDKKGPNQRSNTIGISSYPFHLKTEIELVSETLRFTYIILVSLVKVLTCIREVICSNFRRDAILGLSTIFLSPSKQMLGEYRKFRDERFSSNSADRWNRQHQFLCRQLSIFL